MQVDLLTPADYNEVIIFFSGFGSNKSFFQHLTLPKKTLIFISNYQNNLLNLDFLKDKKITLIAWSMGVAMANRFLPKNLNVIKKIAINGTLQGIDKKNGIPPAIFKYTIKNFNLEIFKKNTFENTLNSANNFLFPKKESLIMELQNIYDTLLNIPSKEEIWDKILISRDDKIFETKYQLNAWENCKPIKINTPHFPFFEFDDWDMLCNI
ncbi:DUF452 domain-containing protein [Helicobacter anseris]|uniref:DUF452 domain-containing protein n=1 Tax=Helicobacter anseris TaxID=375926 RepID=A0A3D8JAN4_9HELI|nr:pimeloyl-ACP methyl esterase BioG family protein [Helicobacter anseris]RDU74360.1 DUF452 domain-containing protein [Helicobacter anseris]